MKSKLFTVAAALFVAAFCGPVLAHGGEDHSQDSQPPASARPGSFGPPGEAVSARRLPDGSLFVPKAVQRELGLRHVVVTVGDLAATVEFNGKVIADPNASGRVQATQAGRVDPVAGGLPTVGQNVTQFQRRADAYTRGLARRPWACQTDQRGFA